MIANLYSQKTQIAQALIDRNKKIADKYTNYRLFSLLLAGAASYFLFQTNLYIVLSFYVMFILFFYFLVKKYEAYTQKWQQAERLLEVLDNEKGQLQDFKNKYPNGIDFGDPTHPYTDDLDIFGEKSLFHRLNRCQTPLGQTKLAAALSNPQKAPNIEEKQQIVQELSTLADFRNEFMAALLPAKEIDFRLFESLKTISLPPDLPFEKALKWYLKILPFIWLGVVFYTYKNGLEAGAILAGILGGFHFILAGLNNKKINTWLVDFSGSGSSILIFEEALALIGNQHFEHAFLQKLKEQLPSDNQEQPLKTFALAIKKLAMKKNPFAAIFLYVYSPFDVGQVIKLRAWLNKYPHFFEQIFELIGEFEYWNSLATFHFNHQENYVFPKLISNQSIKVSAIGLGHPLIPADMVVVNDFDLNEKNKISLITGSNMSGKSTFLRSLGVNIILANAGTSVFAKTMSLSKEIELISYMRIKDSLLQNASTFKAEIDRLSMIVQSLRNRKNAIYLIDEMLRGTNSEDKLKGSMALLEELVKYQATALLATHDLRMTEIADKYPEKVKNYFFEYQSDGQILRFDYKIKEGVCQSFNASELLRQIGLSV